MVSGRPSPMVGRVAISTPAADRAMKSGSESTTPGHQRLALVALSALGVVFGDLGTSPLYALQEAFHGGRGVTPTPDNVLGIVSLFLWALILMVSVKYVAVLMRAGNRGEGGILALLALLIGDRKHPVRRMSVFVALALLGTAMLYGDGLITPAISVLSAVEGLQIATPTFQPYVVPITIAILVGLFAVQYRGSGRVGAVFGPVLALWFVVIAILGVHAIGQDPSILAALNPLHGFRFFARNGMHGFLALGAVVLCLTGGEALYADMGHFGPNPIRVAWYFLALPALVASYLGQGALLLLHPAAADRPFYSMVPTWGLYPMVALATAATIIASQALISAVFSLTRQAAQLGYSPRVHVVHTSGSSIGQIYLPGLNWMLLVGTIVIVLAFRSSDRLAAAFGLAVSTTMAITTILFAAVARTRWRWPRWRVAGLAGVFLVADVSFVIANAFKFRDGGWLPVVLGAAVFVIMSTWQMGRRLLSDAARQRGMPIADFLTSLAINPPHRVLGTGVFLTAEASNVPLVLLHHLKHNQVLHQNVVLLTLITEEVPRVPELERVHTTELSLGFYSVVARHGFMEQPDVPAVVERAAAGCAVNGNRALANELGRTTYFLGRVTIVPPAAHTVGRMMQWRVKLFQLLKRNERSANLYFHIPANRVVELGTRVEL
jgi:KUP system potassium uptake protein